MEDEKVGKLSAILVIATHSENCVYRRLLKDSYFENIWRWGVIMLFTHIYYIFSIKDSNHNYACILNNLLLTCESITTLITTLSLKHIHTHIFLYFLSNGRFLSINLIGPFQNLTYGLCGFASTKHICSYVRAWSQLLGRLINLKVL